MLDFHLNTAMMQAEPLAQVPRNKPRTFKNNVCYVSLPFLFFGFLVLVFLIYSDHFDSRKGRGELVLE